MERSHDGSLARRMTGARAASRSEIAARATMARAIAASRDAPDGLVRIEQTAANLVRAAGADQHDILSAVSGAVSGAVDAGVWAGIDRGRAAAAAAMGALEGAGALGEAAVEHVKMFVTRPIGVVTPLHRQTFAEGRRTP